MSNRLCFSRDDFNNIIIAPILCWENAFERFNDFIKKKKKKSIREQLLLLP